MSVKNILFCVLLMAQTCLGPSCKKYLDAKPDKSLAVPSTLRDLSMMLDNEEVFIRNKYPSFGMESCDDYYLLDAVWTGLSNTAKKNNYIWKKDDQNADYWAPGYAIVFNANVVLDELEGIAPGASAEKDRIKGSALFFRAYALYELSQVYCVAYNDHTAEAAPGLPLRLNSDYNVASFRASLKATYQQIITDLKEALLLVPQTSLYKSRPGKAAVYGALSRVYLSMQNYIQAGAMADAALEIQATLMNYQDMDLSSSIPFELYNPEVILHTTTGQPQNISASRAKVDTVLYSLYAADDLRLQAFFLLNSDGTHRFKGGYEGGGGTGGLFNGLAVDEMLLTRAECRARNNQVELALADVQTLLSARFAGGNYVLPVITTAEEALELILLERRKELCFRTRRFSDLKRLNLDPDHATDLHRLINGELYTLAANDPRYLCLIPEKVIRYSPILQNP